MLTSESSNRLLAVYEAMAVAARDNDWDQLADLGRVADDIRKEAQKSAAPADPLPESEDQIVDRVRRILELDLEIRTHAEPALQSTRKLLSGSVKDQAVRNAYGSTSL